MLRFAETRLAPVPIGCHSHGPMATTTNTKPKARRKRKPGCESCFFGCRDLCALDLGGPCATFRPDTPDGLLPPRQPALLIREAEGAVLAVG